MRRRKFLKSSLIATACGIRLPLMPFGTESKGKPILIVYLTRTHNTEAVARIISEQTGGKLIAIELVRPYPANYKAQVAQVVEENSKGFLPPLATKIENIASYDIVFLGFPTWDMQMPPPVKSFLKQHNLSGKTVIPFNTNAGYGVGSGFDTVKLLCPKSEVLDGISIKGGIERDKILFVMKGTNLNNVKKEIYTWLNKLPL